MGGRGPKKESLTVTALTPKADINAMNWNCSKLERLCGSKAMKKRKVSIFRGFAARKWRFGEDSNPRPLGS